METKANCSQQAGYAVTEWCALVGISRALFYTLPPLSKPAATKIGDRLLVYEKPGDWLERIAQAGGVRTKTRGGR